MRLLTLLTLAASLGLGGCERGGGGGSATKEHPDLAGYPTPARAPDQSYTVKGRVAGLPETGKPATEFRVEHEAIPNFVNRKGQAVGMSHMIMHFPPAKGVSVSQFTVGQPVEIDFSVWWGESPSYLVTAIRPLPADTKFTFESPPADAPKPAGTGPG
jgi:hypothetical protein